MKILLSHGYFLSEDLKEQQIMRPYPPLGLLYIAAYLEAKGFPTDVCDTTFLNRDDFYRKLDTHPPQILGLYSNLMTKPSILAIIRHVKTNLPGATVIIGGPDARFNAENYLRNGADVVAVGEGEESMHDLVNAVASGNPIDLIDGIAFLRADTLVLTGEREKIRDLDFLPVPARHKIDLHRYLDTWRTVHGKSAVSVSTMRGCPYTCKWCSRAVYGLSYRRRSARMVVEELAMLQATYKPDTVWFVDDVFTISHVWLEQFRDELKKRKVQVAYECITRADRMNEKVVAMLKETGCFRVWIGAESGSQRVIDLMDRRVDVKQVRDMIVLTKKYKIEAGTFIMLGYPGEDEADIRETIAHLKASNPDHFTITVAYPIKGTELFEEVNAGLTSTGPWETTTDRQIDFRRTYSRKYYDYAVRHVISEVNYYKTGNSLRNLTAVRHKMKSLAAKTGMKWERLVTKFI